ncbi:hypothetical protein GOP47_0029875 [Adiantum capillus-veneris]|nr:hypothetical protein GOP47_0029875 [Adiantum capillus-veneris]
MKQEDLPPSWVLRTHFSRAVYYRSDTCIDASWFEVPRKPSIVHARRTAEKHKQTEKCPPFLESAPSLDVFSQQATLQPLEKVRHENSVEGEDFSFSTMTCTSRVCESPPLNFIKDASVLSLSPSRNEEISALSATVHKLQSTIGDFLSRSPLRKSLSYNNLLRNQNGMEICASKTSSPQERSTAKRSVWDSPRCSPLGTPKSSPTNSPRYDSKETSPFDRNSAASGNPTDDVSGGSPVKRDIIRALSWSDHLSNATGNARAVLSAENWMIDLSQLLLSERFASGAYSRLYRGIYQDTPVAVKIIRQPDEDEFLADRLEKVFMQEVNTLSCLQHQNVVKFIAACKKPPVLCVITEYLPGGSIRAFLHKREGELLPIPQVLQMALDIAYGMEYLHMKGVVHRDLKSENLVLGQDGCIKILDFGVSCFESDCNSDAHDLGTYRWMAPEMLSQKPYTRKVDVYSFGIVLWELLTAHLPYEEMGAVQAAFCVIHENTRPPIPPDCPTVLSDLMCRCWCTDPEGSARV